MTKYQHYVPQFYLRNFLSQKVVQVLDIKLMKIAPPRGTRRIGGMEFFYGTETGVADANSQVIEDWFSKVESELTPQVDVFTNKILNNKQIEPQDKYDIGFLMSMLWVRGLEMREKSC
jgi:hypothetical protein